MKLIQLNNLVIVITVLTVGFVSGQDDAVIPLDDMEADELLTTQKPADVILQLPAELALTDLEKIMAEGSGDVEVDSEAETLPRVPILKQMMYSVEEGAQKCSNEDDGVGGVVFNCVGAKLAEMPKDLNSSIEDLNMKENNFTSLAVRYFSVEFLALKRLSMASNQISEIERSVFEKIPKLEQLNLDSNRLTSLDVEVFSSLEFLNDLDLSCNPLAPLPVARMFLNAPAMKKLRLSNCNLTAVPENAFDGMTSLTVLDIGLNPIDEKTPITGSVFAALTNLTSVTLPAGVSDELVSEVCKSHGVLETVCVTPCNDGPIYCGSKLTPAVANDEVDSRANAGVVTVAIENMAEDSVTTTAAPNNADEGIQGSEITRESAPSSSTGSSNKTVIGVIIGGILVAIVIVVVKKNWKKITRRGRGIEGNGTVGVSKTAADERLPEEIPLQNNSPA